MQIKQNSSTEVIKFFMADTTDLTQGKTGLSSFTVKTSRRTQTVLSTQGVTVTEIGEGWYQFTMPSAAVSEIGQVALQVAATGAVTWRDVHEVVYEKPGELTDATIAEIVAKIFRTTMDAIEDSSEGTAITTTNLSLYKAVMSLVGKVALISTTKRIYQTDENTTALDLTMTSGQGPASPFISQEP